MFLILGAVNCEKKHLVFWYECKKKALISQLLVYFLRTIRILSPELHWIKETLSSTETQTPLHSLSHQFFKKHIFNTFMSLSPCTPSVWHSPKHRNPLPTHTLTPASSPYALMMTCSASFGCIKRDNWLSLSFPSAAAAAVAKRWSPDARPGS